MKIKTVGYYEVRKITSLKDMVKQSAEKYSSYDAFTLKNSQGNFYGITYKQFQEQMNALGTTLLDMGLQNAKIAVLSENRYEWCLTYLAVANGVGTIVPLDKELPENEITSLLARSEAKAIVTSAGHL